MTARGQVVSARSRARKRWHQMIQRCTNPADWSWQNYGARGITVCDEWLTSFDAYYAHVGDAPEGKSIDRIDNDGPYAPGNVRWATASEQMLNRRDPNLAKTHCPQDHPYDQINTYVTPTGKRDCRECRRVARRRHRAITISRRVTACQAAP